MILQKYEVNDLGNIISGTGMHFCLVEAIDLMKSGEDLGYISIRRLMKLREDYAGYRDFAMIKRENVSDLPGTIHVPEKIAVEIDKINARDKRIMELKAKLGKL